MFTTFIVQPIFNLLVLIYALLPGHNFGLAIIIFTVIIRLALWPLVRKQLHQTKLMRSIQPELKKIAKETKGNRQKQYQMQTELYKERGINQFSTLGVALLQLPILIGLYSGLHRVIIDPHQMVRFAYPSLQHLPWMEKLAHNIHLFDSSLFGVVDLSRAAIGPKGLYLPAMVIVLASAVTQFFQARQLMPKDKEGRGLKAILKDAGSGKQADQTEVSAAVGKSTQFILPVMIFLFTVRIASALGLYWFIGGLVAFIQQSFVLREDSTEMTELSSDGAAKPAGKDTASIPEAEIVSSAVPGSAASKAPSSSTEQVTEHKAPSGTIKITRQITKQASPKPQKSVAGNKKRRKK